MAKPSPRGCVDLDALEAPAYAKLRANLAHQLLRRFPQFANGRMIDGRDLEDVVSDVVLAALERQRATDELVSFGVLQHRAGAAGDERHARRRPPRRSARGATGARARWVPHGGAARVSVVGVNTRQPDSTGRGRRGRCAGLAQATCDPNRSVPSSVGVFHQMRRENDGKRAKCSQTSIAIACVCFGTFHERPSGSVYRPWQNSAKPRPRVSASTTGSPSSKSYRLALRIWNARCARAVVMGEAAPISRSLLAERCPSWWPSS